MATKLCPCPDRKCGSLATPHVIEYVTEHIGTQTLEQLQAWCIQHFEWRRKQEEAYGKGVQSFNVEKAIEQVKGCKTKGGLLDLLENKANRYHETIMKNQQNNELQTLNEDCPPEVE